MWTYAWVLLRRRVEYGVGLFLLTQFYDRNFLVIIVQTFVDFDPCAFVYLKFTPLLDRARNEVARENVRSYVFL